MAEFLKFGHIISIHGFKGWMKCAIEKEYALEMVANQSWIHLLIDGKPVPFFVDEIKDVGINLLALKLKWVDDQAQAQNLIGLKLVSNNINKKDVVAINSFVGWTLLDKGLPIGQVVHVDDNEFQCLLYIDRPNGEELLVPFHEDFLISRNEKEKQLELDLPEGLLKL